MEDIKNQIGLQQKRDEIESILWIFLIELQIDKLDPAEEKISDLKKK